MGTARTGGRQYLCFPSHSSRAWAWNQSAKKKEQDAGSNQHIIERMERAHLVLSVHHSTGIQENWRHLKEAFVTSPLERCSFHLSHDERILFNGYFLENHKIHTLSLTSILAPLRRSIRTMAADPTSDATNRGVFPNWKIRSTINREFGI